MACWSDLFTDVLENITRFLLLPDHHRFSAVCRNWRFVAQQKHHLPVPQLPWLVLRDEPGTRKRIFYNLSEDRHYTIDIPESYGRYICGSSHGWLIAIDIKITGILINPFTREFYELPPFPPYDELTDVTTLIEKVPDDYIGRCRSYTFEEMQTLLVSKAILSHDPKKSPDFTLMILVGALNKPAFWKPGSSSWTVVNGERLMMYDVIYFKGRFIFVNVLHQLLALEFEPDLKLSEVKSWTRFQYVISQSYLVDYFGDLLIIDRSNRAIDKGHYKTYQFVIMEPDFEESAMYQWSGVSDYALFVGTNDSLIIDSNEVPGCKINSIYFTNVTRSLSKKKYGCDDIGIFDMTNKTFDTFYPPEIHLNHVGAPIWFTPNM